MGTQRRILSQPGRFRAQEDGGATAFGIFTFGLMLLTVGLAIDVTNAYRHTALLQVAADSAAQAGIVALTRGEDADTVRRAAEAMIEMNMPEASYGRLMTDPSTELQVLHYDPATGKFVLADTDDPANAVVVRLQRSTATGNPVPTFLMGMAGQEAWSLAATSVAVLGPTQRCGNAEGIIARGGLNLGAAPEIGAGFCLHSQTGITLSAGTRTTGPLRISLPDPTHCEGACDPAAALGPSHPDTYPMALNLVMPQTRDHVAGLAMGFTDPAVTLPEETGFFATRPLDGDPEALREVGISTDSIRAGDVVRMTALQFSQLRERPAGLVYDVRCDTIENDPRPVWERTVALIGDGYGPTLRDLVLVTDCTIEMDETVRVEGVLILLTGPGEARIEALPGATLGDPKATCDPARRVRLMALGDMALPADIAGSNVSAVAGGDIRLESHPDQWLVAHNGLVLHAGGSVTAEGRHSFALCPADPSDPLLPAMQVISYAMPHLGDVLAPAKKAPPKADLPGKDVAPMPLHGTINQGS